MVLAIFIENMLDDGVPILPREIEVEVGRAAPHGVEETLEIQVQLYGVDIGDLQAVGHHAVGAAATSHMVEALFHGKLHNLPSDEEIGAEAHPFDDLQFFLDAAVSGLVGRAIAIGHAVEGQFAQQLVVVVDVARKAAFAFYARVDADFTLFQDIFRIFN